MLWRREVPWFVEVEGGVVGWVSGGEPVDGCDVVSALIFAPTPAIVEQRMKQIGLWDPYTMPKFYKHGRSGIAEAVKDPEGFVWNHADGGQWLPSSSLPRPSPDHAPFWAYVYVESSDRTLAELSAAIGLDAAERSHDIGDMNLRRNEPRDLACWVMDLVLDPTVHAGTDGLSQAIESLDDALADRLAVLAATSCDVGLNIVQELDGDSYSTGINLTAEALAWVARARAEIDIDQYVLVDEHDAVE